MSSPIVVIPARMASTRLPEKPLALIHGEPMIAHVWRRAAEADIGPVLVATDDERIVAAVEAAGGRAILTRADHASGSDRIFEAVSAVVAELLAKKLAKDPDTVVSATPAPDTASSHPSGGGSISIPIPQSPEEKTSEPTDAWTALTRATTERARFLARLEIAAMMVAAGRLSVAKPLLQQLIEQIKERNLAEWEDTAIIARPFALMIRCLDAGEEEPDTRAEYYVQVCRLSPIQALGLAK